MDRKCPKKQIFVGFGVWVSVGPRSTSVQNQYRNWLRSGVNISSIYIHFDQDKFWPRSDWYLYLKLTWSKSSLDRGKINRGRTTYLSQLRYWLRTTVDKVDGIYSIFPLTWGEVEGEKGVKSIFRFLWVKVSRKEFFLQNNLIWSYILG